MTIPSGHERSYSMLLRSRAILFPMRIRILGSLSSTGATRKYASTCAVIGTSPSVKPNSFASARACHQVEIDLANEKVLVKLGRACDDGAVWRDDLRPSPESDPVLVPDAVDVDDIEREVLGVEAVHKAARLGRAEVTSLGHAATRARRRRQHHGRARGGVQVRGRNVPEVFAERDAGRSTDGFERFEAVPWPEVAAIVKDPVRRQVDLAVHVHELAL